MDGSLALELWPFAEPEPSWWASVEPDLAAPFPWFGGKSRVADLVWERFGEVPNYVEPFAGSLAVLLGRPHAPKIETVNDFDCHLANFWRALRGAPEGLARAADYPVNEAELHARHRYLVKLKPYLRERLLTDPTWCHPGIAGWWVWGLCAWIGSGWCSDPNNRKRPDLASRAGDGRTQATQGRGVHAATMKRPMPHFGGSGMDMGLGIHAQSMRLPMLGAGSGWDGEPQAHQGKGVHGASMRTWQQLPSIGSKRGQDGGGGDGSTGINTLAMRSRLPDVFAALANRLRYTRVACGDFERILSPAITWKHGLTGVFLDPPYPPDAGLTGGLYASTSAEREVFDRAFRYCISNGDRQDLRIALCYYEGTKAGAEDVSKALANRGWDVVAWKAAGGYGGRSETGKANARRERIAFSPACLKAQQLGLFG